MVGCIYLGTTVLSSISSKSRGRSLQLVGIMFVPYEFGSPCGLNVAQMPVSGNPSDHARRERLFLWLGPGNLTKTGTFMDALHKIHKSRFSSRAEVRGEGLASHEPGD